MQNSTGVNNNSQGKIPPLTLRHTIGLTVPSLEVVPNVT